MSDGSRLMIVDDHPVMRDGVRQLFERNGFMICGEAETADDALGILDESSPDLVLLDLRLKTGNGLSLLEKIREKKPTLPVVIFTMHDDAQTARKALRIGANGFISKADSPAELVSALKACLSGKTYISASVERAAGRSLLQESTMPEAELGEREREVYILLGQGYRIKEAAKALKISISTVETHCARIRGKWNLSDNNELIRHAVQHAKAEPNGL